MKVNTIVLALTSLATVALGNGHSRICKEGEMQCNADLFSAQILACKNGRWELLQNCRPGQGCAGGSRPLCKSASATADEAVSGFENPVTTDSNKDDLDTVDKLNSRVASYSNICIACVRHNDKCKSDCEWQGSECNRLCNSMTCSVNVNTGDIRRPTVACGRFCKWPCQ